jgi:prepilin-type N-terminal cleavage/methylation domain-containing protein/prepilin-type processing-associated H-X9-DG protein
LEIIMHFPSLFILGPRQHKKSGFTLIELLVVIAIISLLAAILFPVFSRARESARRSSCLSNMKQVGLGMMQYMADYDDVYPSYYNDTDHLRWPQMMVPYVKSTQVYTCPSRTYWEFKGDYTSAGTIGYGMNDWLNSWWYPSVTNKGIRMSTIQRPAETVWIAEINGIAQTDNPASVNAYLCYPSWDGAVNNRTYPTYGFDVVPEGPGRLASRHLDGLNVIWADGHVKWTKRDILESDIGSTCATCTSAAQAGSKYWWGR